jgi:hypothetical protein
MGGEMMEDTCPICEGWLYINDHGNETHNKTYMHQVRVAGLAFKEFKVILVTEMSKIVDKIIKKGKEPE